VRDCTLEDYRTALADVLLSPAFVLGMPVLVDIRASTSATASDEYERCCASLARLATPSRPLRLAVLTTEANIPIALRTVNNLADQEIQACAFTDYTTAVTWLGVMAQC
jgi:hypothetical protein